MILEECFTSPFCKSFFFKGWLSSIGSNIVIGERDEPSVRQTWEVSSFLVSPVSLILQGES